MKTNRTLAEIEHDIGVALAAASDLLVDKEAKLIAEYEPKGFGRLGKITDVMANHRGELLACFYVYRMGSKDILNSEPWTRQYRPLSELELHK